MVDARLFVSVFAYSFGKAHYPNVDRAIAAELEKGESSLVPAFRTVHRLRRSFDVTFAPECSTLIGKARNVMSGKFLSSGIPLWVSIDDDVDASADALHIGINGTYHVVDGWAAHDAGSRIIIGGMKTRTNDKYNIGLTGVDPLDGGDVAIKTGELMPITYGGAALTFIPYKCLARMVNHHGGTAFDEGGVGCPGLFKEEIVERCWIGEDVMFCRRARAAGVPLYGFIHPGIVHAGIPSISSPNNMVLNWRAGEDCCDKRDAALAENARLREALTRFDQLVEAAQTSHAADGYTDADVQVGKFQDELPALLVLAATDQPKKQG
jgi:hypothetical protein